MLQYVIAALLSLVPAGLLHAAVIRGVVVENLTGKPLARTPVRLEPIGGTPGSGKTVRANSLGVFEFNALPAGAYIVKASREGFLPLEFGQKRWNSAGMPAVIEQEASAFLNIRLIRQSAITGMVVDENDVGIAGFDVIAYRKTEPPQRAAQATTDERGIYRLHGLDPGTYVVSTAGTADENGAYLPTFSRETVSLTAARTVDLFPDQEAGRMDVRPLPGQLFRVVVGVESTILDVEITITLSSVMGRKTVKGSGFVFTGLVAGEYEVSAQQGDVHGAVQRVSLARDAQITLVLPQPPIQVLVAGGDSGELRVRRKDLAGAGPAFLVPLVGGRAILPRGHWELMLIPSAGSHVSGVSPRSANPSSRADCWNEIYPAGSTFVRFSVSSGASAIHGVVKDAAGQFKSAGDAVSGVPVYLEPYEPLSRKRVGDLRIVRTDVRGQYRFEGLAPGSYRILSTFEYLAPDVETMDIARALPVTIDTRNELSRDLDLYVIQ